MSLIEMMLTANSLSCARKSARENEKKKSKTKTNKHFKKNRNPRGNTRNAQRTTRAGVFPADFRAKERLQSRNDAKPVRIDETIQDERWLT